MMTSGAGDMFWILVTSALKSAAPSVNEPRPAIVPPSFSNTVSK